MKEEGRSENAEARPVSTFFLLLSALALELTAREKVK
jgi:hypothetical protein